MPPATEDDGQPEEPTTPPTEEPTSQVENPEAHDLAQVQVEHHQQEAPLNDSPVVIVPSGYTQTSCQVRRLAQFAFAAYHCKHLAQTGIQSVFDFHPFASLCAFASTITQPDGYPDAMPLNMAIQQSNQDKFIHAMARELCQHMELKHWKIIHKSQVMKNVKPIPIIWTLQHKQDPAGEILKWKARLAIAKCLATPTGPPLPLWYHGQQSSAFSSW